MALGVKAPPPGQIIPIFQALASSRRFDWAYAETNKRDLRLDFLRGFAVFMMVVDHFGGCSWLYLVTGGNAFYTSGAEAFVFISGFVMGTVYRAVAWKEGLKTAQIKALKRAMTFYKLNVVITLLFAALSLHLNLPWAQGLVITDPFKFAFDVITLHQTMYLTDIPMLNSLLMLLATFGLWMLYTKRTTWLLTGSGTLWLAFQLFPIQAQVPWPIVGNTTFHLAAWQLLFFLAMTLGYHRKRIAEKLSQIPRLPYFIFSGLLLLWLTQLHASNGAMLNRILPEVYETTLMTELFQKSALAPGRLVASFIVFQFAYLAATLFWKPLSANFGWILFPLGQNSLYCYTVHIFVIGLFYAALPRLPINVTTIGFVNTTLQLLVIILLWAMVKREFLFRIVPR